MACCGQKRAQLSLNGRVAAVANKVIAVPSPALLFEYTGNTELRVLGSVTGRTYRFTAPGARVQVDARDVRALAATPNLKQLRG